MSCKRTSVVSVLVVALLISSMLTPHLPIACAHHVAVLKANNGQNFIGHVSAWIDRTHGHATKERSVSTGDLADGKKGLEGRKLGARDMEETEAVGVDKKGKANSVANAGSRPGTAEMRTPTKRRDAATELYDMLKRDYASRARRRSPINNGEPLQEEEP